jgi:hypothetical protein
MAHTRRHAQTYLGSAEYLRLQREATTRRSTISKCMADCLREYFALRTELATAIEMPGKPGDQHEGSVIHTLLARSEERLVATFDRGTVEILGELRRLTSMLDRLVMMYLIHTPEVSGELLDGAIASARRRYTNYEQAVNTLRAKNERGGRGGTAPTRTGESTPEGPSPGLPH